MGTSIAAITVVLAAAAATTVSVATWRAESTPLSSAKMSDAVSNAPAMTVRPCTDDQLDVHLGSLLAALGTSYRDIRMTDVSRDTCLVRGTPRVAFLNQRGVLIGWPAEPVDGARHTVLLRPGDVTKAAVGIPSPANFIRGDCLAYRSESIRIAVGRPRDGTVVDYRTDLCTTRLGRPVVRVSHLR